MDTNPTQKTIQDYLNNTYPAYNLIPFQEYTQEEISKATNIYINTDDCQWQLGYEDELDWSIEPSDYFGELPIYID